MALSRIWRKWLIRLAGSAVMLAVLFWIVPWSTFRQALSNVSAADFLMVLAAFLVAHVAAGAKWWWLMGHRVPLALALRAHFTGLAANLCLPGAIGGDAVRATMAHMSMKDGARTVAAALADRMIDMAALGSLTLLGLVASGAESSGMTALPTLAVLAVVLLIVAFLPRLMPLPWRIVPSLPGRALADKLAEAFREFGEAPLRLAGAFLASFLIQGALVLLSLYLARAAGLQVSTAAWVFAWPLAKILAVLPISLNGLGLRESVLAGLLTPFGANPAVVVAAGLMWQAVLFCGGGVGGLIYAATASHGKRIVE